MPYCSPKSTRAIADHEHLDTDATMLRAADGHRSPPRYPDGRDFDICDHEMVSHQSHIRDPRGDFT